MAETDRLSLRDQPPVEPVDPPARFSQTLLGHADVCKRAAYLYQRYRGGAPAHELDRGTAAHLVFERLMLTLIEHGEESLYAPVEGEDPLAAKREVASLTAAVVEEVRAERRELTLKASEWDDVREMAFHWAVGNDVPPSEVVAVERKLVLDLECGVTVSGKVDLAWQPREDLICVRDYKTAWNVESQEEFEEWFQTKLYGLLLLLGRPVRAGFLAIGEPEEVQLDRLGEGVNLVRCEQAYPRYLTKDRDAMQTRGATFTRTEMLDFKQDVEALAADLIDRFGMFNADHPLNALSDRFAWRFPAVPGSHCSRCPAPSECPLPPNMRRRGQKISRHAGQVNTLEQASEAAAVLDRVEAEVKALKAELRGFASLHGPIPFGTDKAWQFASRESSTTDWEGLDEALERAVMYGEPFDRSRFIRRRPSTAFVVQKVPRREQGGQQDDDERFGADAPF